MTNRQHARKIIDRICIRECGLSLSDLPDLPCVMNALDEMEEMIEQDGEFTPMSELENAAQDAVFELLEEEGFPLD